VIIDVDGLKFDFPDGWDATKYDDWAFYRLQFGKMWNGIKAVDLLAIDPSGNLWLVEVKDYRPSPPSKPTDLSDDVAHKVFDTLAALLPARMNGNDTEERRLAGKALHKSMKRLRVVLHLEQPAKHSKLFPRAIDPANVKQQLTRLLKPIDPHPVVVERGNMGPVQWTVT
jgi:hypothetical protein